MLRDMNLSISYYNTQIIKTSVIEFKFIKHHIIQLTTLASAASRAAYRAINLCSSSIEV